MNADPGPAGFDFTDISDARSMRDLRKSLATSSLLVHCEKLCASGYLPTRDEAQLRWLIAEVRCAFGPSIPERELPENVVALTRGSK